jgi:hypothetical protein
MFFFLMSAATFLAASSPGEEMGCTTSIPGAKTIYCLQTAESGLLAIVEVRKACKYAVTLAGKEILKTDCTTGKKTAADLFPIIEAPVLIYRGSTEFNEILALPQLMTGNSCGGGMLRFLSIRGASAGGEVVVADLLTNCDESTPPIFTAEPTQIRVGWPNTKETWILEGGKVRRVAGLRNERGKAAKPSPSWAREQVRECSKSRVDSFEDFSHG